MRKIFSLIAAVLFAGSMMADNFVLVTDASTLAAGDQIIITNETATKAISATQATNNRPAVDVTANENVIVPGEDVQVITLEASGDYWMLNVGEDAYLYAAGGTSNPKNNMKTATAAVAGDNGKFAISITDNVATVVSQGDCQRNNMRYNENSQNGNPLFSLYATTSSVSEKVKIYKLDGEVTPPTIVAPVISGDETFTESTTITITCATEGAEILYTLDGTDPHLGAQIYTGPFEITETTTVTACGVFIPDVAVSDWSAVVTKTFTKVEPAQAITCADVYNMAKNDVVDLLNDVVVTYVNGANVYVKDATASMLIYLPKNTTVDWVAGNVLSGVAGVVDVYNGLYEVKPSADQIAAVTATAGEAPAAEELTTITAADVNKYASISNVTVAAGEFVTTSATNLDMVLNGTTYVLRNNFKIAYTFEAGREYNMVGVVSIYTKNDVTTLQFFPITIEKIIGAAIENTNVEAETVKFFENGQLFINKNGVIYNAQGTIVR